uniref:Peptide/nickel transport system substrate-binding protein n=1 Tax=Candidatus Kentrum sp. DK TaxID=2126562 RepID=A0A450S5T0_9GAMM|nr:MAG: peptide/nickel transport system substrate-binding protein [Candidatus Kentron sp. DK]
MTPNTQRRHPKPRLLPVCLALLLSACGGPPSGAPDSPASATSDTPSRPLRFGLAASPITLDPRFATDATSSRLVRLLYDRLVDFDQNYRPRPSLAHWRKITPRQYRVILNPKRRPFHNGARLTAADVKATYDAILDPDTASPHRGILTGIRTITLIDQDTLDFHLNAADALFPGRLTIGILPRQPMARGHPFSRTPIGSGPLALVAWPSTGALQLRRLADGQRITFPRVAEATVRVLKLVRGEIDLLQNDLLPELITWLAGRDDVIVQTAPGGNFSYLGFQLQDPIAGDVRVRRAIAHALDREAIIRHLRKGAARMANALLPPDHWAGAPSLAPIPFDPARARALLKEAGYTGDKRPRLVYKTSSDPFRVRLATLIQDQLARAGIDIEIRSHDWGTFYGDIKAGRFQLYSLAWVGIDMPDIFRYAFHSASLPPAGANRGRFSDPVADALIEKAEAAEEPLQQATHYRQLQRHLLQRLPYVPLWYEDNVLVTGRHVRGYRLSPNGNYDGLLTVRISRQRTDQSPHQNTPPTP